MTKQWPIRDVFGWKTQLCFSVSFAFVLGLSVVIPINDCVVGGFGDVSDVLGTTWTLTTGSATLVSFVLTVRKFRAESTEQVRTDESTDSHTAIHVESVEGDVDLNVTLSDTHREYLAESNISRPPNDYEVSAEDTDEPDSNGTRKSGE